MARIMDWKGRTGDAWAAEWRRMDRAMAGVTERLLAKTAEYEFESVLDIGCGAGELALAIGRNRPGARIIGLDISAELVAVARQRGESLSNVSFVEGDAARWMPEADFAPELLISRHGVMFFPDPVSAFAHLAELAAPDAALVFSCFRGPEVNEMMSGIPKLLPGPLEPPDPNAPGPLAFADPARVRDVLGDAGWHDIELDAFDFRINAGAGDEPVGDALSFLNTIGPAADAVLDLPPEDQAAFRDKLRDFVRDRLAGGVIAFDAGGWIVTARAPSTPR